MPTYQPIYSLHSKLRGRSHRVGLVSHRLRSDAMIRQWLGFCCSARQGLNASQSVAGTTAARTSYVIHSIRSKQSASESGLGVGPLVSLRRCGGADLTKTSAPARANATRRPWFAASGCAALSSRGGPTCRANPGNRLVGMEAVSGHWRGNGKCGVVVGAVRVVWSQSCLVSSLCRRSARDWCHGLVSARTGVVARSCGPGRWVGGSGSLCAVPVVDAVLWTKLQRSLLNRRNVAGCVWLSMCRDHFLSSAVKADFRDADRGDPAYLVRAPLRAVRCLRRACLSPCDHGRQRWSPSPMGQ